MTTESGNDRKCPPASCRDKGRGGVDEGAWCLSSLGCDLFAPRNPQMDRVATRTSTRPPPCSTSAPCPYRTGNAHSPIRSSKFIIGQWPVDALPRPIKIFTNQDRPYARFACDRPEWKRSSPLPSLVTLSTCAPLSVNSAKGLSRWAQRCFAALSMTRPALVGVFRQCA